MGSPRPAVAPTGSFLLIFLSMSLAIPGFFTSGSLTVNAIPAILALVGLAALAIPLLLPLLFPPAADGGSGYGSTYEVQDAYGAPEASYGAPSSGYGRLDEGYEGYRALSGSTLDTIADPYHDEVVEWMQKVAGPAISRLGEAAAKII